MAPYGIYGWFDGLMDDLSGLKGSFVTIGIHEKDGDVPHPGHPSRPNKNPELTIAEIAFLNEFGFVLRNGKKVSARSFIRAGTDENRRQIEAVRDKALNDVAAGRISVRKGLARIGFRAREAIKSKMLKGPFAPNEPSTAARKKANKPLIDSTRMLRSVEFEVTTGAAKAGGKG